VSKLVSARPGQAGSGTNNRGDGGNRRSLTLTPPKSPVSEFVVATTLKGGSHDNRGDGGNRRSLTLTPPKSPVSKLVVATTLKGGSHNNRGDGGI
jgi:hypothetical protein